jgi:hypothetical protein
MEPKSTISSSFLPPGNCLKLSSNQKIYIILLPLYYNTKMDENKNQYSDRIRYENVLKGGFKSLDCLLPEWIMNLKNYFEKRPAR